LNLENIVVGIRDPSQLFLIDIGLTQSLVNEQGKLCVSIRYGTQVMELAKGKTSIEVESAQALIRALELVKQAVEGGELDTQINNASANLLKGFAK
jgi:hypothetical protein